VARLGRLVGILVAAAKQGRLPSLRTLGGHRRFRFSDVEPHLSAME